MTALDTMLKIAENPYLPTQLRYCFVTKEKVPYTGLSPARPNCMEDFIPFEDLNAEFADRYAGVGISIQASGICAIDIDHCFTDPFEKESSDSRGLDIMSMFFNKTYMEFSFSGTGLRILFNANEIENYSSLYYTKNSRTQCEFYHPKGSNRYVTITGRNINQKGIEFLQLDDLMCFLNKYMKKPIREKHEEKQIEVLVDYENMILHFLRTDPHFMDCWFDKAPGYGADESERDFFLVKFIYENICTDYNMIKQIFEKSPFFKSKDHAHIRKWERNDGYYFNYLYNNIRI